MPAGITAIGWVLALGMAITPGLTFFAARGPTPVFLVAALFGLGVLFRRRERPAAVDGALVAILGLLCGWTALSIIWAPDLYFSTRGFFKLSGNMLLGVALLAVARRANADERRLIGRFAIAGLILALVILSVEVVFDGPIKRATWGGMPVHEVFLYTIDTYGHFWANACASVVVVFIWPVIMVLLRAQRAVLALGLIVITTVAVFGIDFSTGGVALVFGMVISGLVYWLRRRAAMAIAVVLVAGIAMAPLLTTTVFTPRAMSEITKTALPTILHRIHIWKFAAEHIAEHPVRGWGMNASRSLPGGTTRAYDEYQDRQLGENMPLHPHNLPLQMWLELGLPGAALLCALVLLIPWRLTGPALGRTGAALACGQFFAVLTISGMSYGAWQSWWIASLWLGAALAAVIYPPPENAG